jgi:hypothetical protein
MMFSLTVVQTLGSCTMVARTRQVPPPGSRASRGEPAQYLLLRNDATGRAAKVMFGPTPDLEAVEQEIAELEERAEKRAAAMASRGGLVQ